MTTATRAVEAWTLQPLVKFVKEAGARLVLLMTSAGQVLAQHGFSRAVDVMSAAALGAAIMASTEEIARQLGQPAFAGLNHQGVRHGIFLAGVTTRRGRLVVLVVYELDASSHGLVQLFFEQLAADLAAASPKDSVPKQVLAADFERELSESLNTLFGR
ncbi:MAG TPA: roadblock/LC7 domain-containing protein [Gemmatimonadales bacterium]|nr:roadblock/LC7 domain-containing protein [Gemmatimonadales bacterium]